MSAIQVRAAGQPDEQAVIDVITLAFSTDPMARWAYPAPETFLGVWPLMVRAFGGAGFAHGTVHLIEGGGAAAMWLPSGVEPDLEALMALTERQLLRILDEAARALGVLFYVHSTLLSCTPDRPIRHGSNA